jgi:hypothetical protein
MDKQTKALYEKLKEDGKDVGSTAWPELKTDLILDGPRFRFYYEEDYRETYFAYAPGRYAEWYRCLSYVLYGYGNWSNNDRRRAGLPALRKSKMKLH